MSTENLPITDTTDNTTADAAAVDITTAPPEDLEAMIAKAMGVDPPEPDKADVKATPEKAADKTEKVADKTEQTDTLDVPDDEEATLDDLIPEIEEPKDEKKEDEKKTEKVADKTEDDESVTADLIKPSHRRMSVTKFERLTGAEKTLQTVAKEFDIPLAEVEKVIPDLKVKVSLGEAHQMLLEDLADPKEIRHVANYLMRKSEKINTDSKGDINPVRNLVVELMAADEGLAHDIGTFASENAIVEFFHKVKSYAASGTTDAHRNILNSLEWIADFAKDTLGMKDLDKQVADYKPPVTKTAAEIRADRAEAELARRTQSELSATTQALVTGSQTKVAELIEKTAVNYVENLISKLKGLPDKSPLTSLRESVIMAVTRDIKQQVAADSKLKAEINGEVQKIKTGKVKTDEGLIRAHRRTLDAILSVSDKDLRDIVKTKVIAHNQTITKSTSARAAKAASVATAQPPAKAGATQVGKVIEMKVQPNESSEEAVARIIRETMGAAGA